MDTLLQSVRGKKVFVGLSGGVDSAVSAALLQKAGADVTGVFIKGWYPPGMPCTWADDRRDAMRVAAHLRIPFMTLDASAEYKKGVIDYLLAEYAAGRTPNPDVMCNREVKFGAFYRFAKEKGADVIATGHYAQVSRDEIATASSVHLMRGIDESKDQSYFLWAIPQEALAYTLFPVGGMPKSDVRMLAEKFNVPVAQKKDSQGICFLGSISVDDFLRHELAPVPGDVVNTAGKKIGAHDGAVLYTLGERIGLKEAEARTDATAGPWYVVRKDLAANTLTVSHAHEAHTMSETISIRDSNFFNASEIQHEAIHVIAQYRYHGPLIPGTLHAQEQFFTPSSPLAEPVASGQSLVFYTGANAETCIGGGIMV